MIGVSTLLWSKQERKFNSRAENVSVTGDFFVNTTPEAQQHKHVGLCEACRFTYRAPNLLSFKGVPSSPSWCFRGYFHPFFINLEGITLMTLCSKLPDLHKPWVNTRKSHFEWGIWILTVKCNAHSFSQYYNYQNQTIIMLENRCITTKLTPWHFYQGHRSSACVWQGGNCSHFFRLTHSAKF